MPYKKLKDSYPQKYHKQETTKAHTSGKNSEQKPKGPEKLVTDEEKQVLRQIYSEATQSTHSLHECDDRNQAERFEAYLNWHFKNQELQIECRVIREKEVNCFQIGLYEKKTPEEVQRIEWGNKKAVMKALIKKWGINERKGKYYNRKSGKSPNPYWKKDKEKDTKESVEKRAKE